MHACPSVHVLLWSKYILEILCTEFLFGLRMIGSDFNIVPIYVCICIDIFVSKFEAYRFRFEYSPHIYVSPDVRFLCYIRPIFYRIFSKFINKYLIRRRMSYFRFGIYLLIDVGYHMVSPPDYRLSITVMTSKIRYNVFIP